VKINIFTFFTFGEDGIMDTCMKGKPQNYFINNPGYEYLGKVKDVFS